MRRDRRTRKQRARLPGHDNRAGGAICLSRAAALLAVWLALLLLLPCARADQFEDLVRSLGSTNEETRVEAADLLTRLGGPRVEQLFREMLASGNPERRQMAAAGLLEVSTDPADLDRLRDRLERDDNSQVRWTAALVLGRAGWPEALPWVRAAATNDSSNLVREAAAAAVDRLEQGIPWRRSVPAALREARELGKPVLVYFRLRGSPYCRRLEQGVLADRGIIDVLQEFVPVRLDAVRAGAETARWDVRGAPTILLLDGHGNEMDRITGLVERDRFSAQLADARRGKLTFREARRRALQHPDDVAANWQVARTYLDDGREEQAEIHLRRVIEHDSDNRHGHTDNALFALGFALGRRGAYAQAVVCLETVLERWPAFKDKDKALYCLGLSQLALGRRDAGTATLERLLTEHPNSSTAAQARKALTRLRKQ